MNKFSITQVKSRDMIGDLGEHNFKIAPKTGEIITINSLRYEVKNVITNRIKNSSSSEHAGNILVEAVE